LSAFGTTDKYLTKVKESQRRKRETDLKENSFWLNSLRSYYQHGEDPRELMNFDTMIENLSLETIRLATARYLNKGNIVKVIMLPE
jgi:zinc protease